MTDCLDHFATSESDAPPALVQDVGAQPPPAAYPRVLCPVEGCNAECQRDEDGSRWPVCYYHGHHVKEGRKRRPEDEWQPIEVVSVQATGPTEMRVKFRHVPPEGEDAEGWTCFECGAPRGGYVK